MMSTNKYKGTLNIAITVFCSVLSFIFSACSNNLGDSKDITQEKLCNAVIKSPKEFQGEEFIGGYEQEIIWEYYLYPEMIEMRYSKPYSYISNKYMDLFIDFLAQCGYLNDVEHVKDFETLQHFPYNLNLQDKSQYIKDVIEKYNDKFENIELNTTFEDNYCDRLATTMNEELNTMTEVLELIDEALAIAEENDTKIDLAVLFEDASIDICGATYNKLDVLAHTEYGEEYPHQNRNS